MWTKKQAIEHAIAWHKQYMFDYDKQWRESGYNSTIAYNLYMKHREKAMMLLTELRQISE